MSNPTTPFGWQMPEATDLVTDLPADFEVFGQAVATDLQYLLGGTTGQVLAKASGTDLDFDWVTDATGMTNPMTTTADVIYSSSGSTPARLGIGTANQVLAVNSGATAPEWQTISSGGMTLISTTTLTGSSILLSSIPQTYKDLQIIIRNFLPATDNIQIRMQFNNDSNSNRHRSLLSVNQLQNTTFNTNYSEVTDRSDNSVDPGLTRIDIYDYTNATTWKIGQTLSFQANATAPSNFNYINYKFVYNQTGAVTSLNFFPESGNFTSGTILLYGVS
jgi:hypothetical protein